MNTTNSATVLKALEYMSFLDINASLILNRPRLIPNLATVITNYSSSEPNSYYVVVSPEDDNNAFATVFHKIIQDAQGNNKLSIVIAVPGIDINQYLVVNSIMFAVDFSGNYKIDAFISKNLKRFAIDMHKYIRYLCLYRNMDVELSVCGTSYGGAMAQVIALLYAHLLGYHNNYLTDTLSLSIVEKLYQTELSYYVITEINAALSVGAGASPVSQFSNMVLEDIYTKNKDPINIVHVQQSVAAIDRIILSRISFKEVYTFGSQCVFTSDLISYYNNFREKANLPTLQARTFNFAFINDALAGMFSASTLFGILISTFSLFKLRYEVGQVVLIRDSVFINRHTILDYYEYILARYNSNTANFEIYTGIHRPFNPSQIQTLLFDLPRALRKNGWKYINSALLGYLIYNISFTIISFMYIQLLYMFIHILKQQTVVGIKFLWWTIQ